MTLSTADWIFWICNRRVGGKRGHNGTRCEDGCGGGGDCVPAAIGSGTNDSSSRRYNFAPATLPASQTLLKAMPSESDGAGIVASAGRVISSSLHLPVYPKQMCPTLPIGSTEDSDQFIAKHIGVARKIQSGNHSIREIANSEGVSPNTVMKVKNTLAELKLLETLDIEQPFTEGY